MENAVLNEMPNLHLQQIIEDMTSLIKGILINLARHTLTHNSDVRCQYKCNSK